MYGIFTAERYSFREVKMSTEVVNLLLFIPSLIICFGISCAIFKAPTTCLKMARRLLIIVLLVMPFNINGTVVTVFGSAENEGDIYSVASLIQMSGGNAHSLASVVQNAKDDAISLFFTADQDAGKNAVTLVGLAISQKAGNTAVLGAGISFLQQAKITILGVGLSLVQEAKEIAGLGFGVSGYQYSVGKANVLAGISIYSKGEDSTHLGLGLAGHQEAGMRAVTALGMALIQRVPGKSRTFAVWSDLSAVDAVEEKKDE